MQDKEIAVCLAASVFSRVQPRECNEWRGSGVEGCEGTKEARRSLAEECWPAATRAWLPNRMLHPLHSPPQHTQVRRTRFSQQEGSQLLHVTAESTGCLQGTHIKRIGGAGRERLGKAGGECSRLL